jgi:hypothetical protein
MDTRTFLIYEIQTLTQSLSYPFSLVIALFFVVSLYPIPCITKAIQARQIEIEILLGLITKS